MCRVAPHDLRAWLVAIGADVPAWLPAPKADKAAAGLARHELNSRQVSECKAALRTLCEAEHAAGRVLSIDELCDRCAIDGRPAPAEYARPIARQFWPDGAKRGPKKRP
jgi:hypothetical protein